MRALVPMGRKKIERKDDRHKPNFMIRLPGAYSAPLDRLVDASPGSDRTEFVREAVREYLERRNLWPFKGDQ